MALTWAAKAPGAVYRYTWTPPLVSGDGLASFTVSVSGAVIDSDEIEDNAVVVYVSGGTAGTTATFDFTATSDQSEEFSETVYLPIVAPDAAGQTVRKVCEFALRKIYGKDETPEASATADALEQLSDLLHFYKMRGVEVGVAFPLSLDDQLLLDDGKVTALKYLLRVRCHNFYDAPLTALDLEQALDADRALRNAAWSIRDAEMPETLRGMTDAVAELF